MKNIDINPRFIAITSLILIAAFARLIPHLPNFTPVSAIALFGGAKFFSKKWAAIVPFAAMLISDFIIGFHSTMYAVYIAFAIIVLIGMSIRNKQNIFAIAGGALLSSVLFFIITNAAVWINGGLYSHDFNGLMTCYISALPFFKYSLMGDLFYVPLLFGSFHLAQVKFPVLAKA